MTLLPSVCHPTNGFRSLGSAVATGSYADLAAVRFGFSDIACSRGITDRRAERGAEVRHKGEETPSQC